MTSACLIKLIPINPLFYLLFWSPIFDDLGKCYDISNEDSGASSGYSGASRGYSGPSGGYSGASSSYPGGSSRSLDE